MTRGGRSPGRHRVTANLFGIPFGFAGLAQCWTGAADADVVPAWPGAIVWWVTAALWAVVAGGWLRAHHRPTDVAHELADPTFGPFVPLIAIVPMLLGGALARVAPTAGQVVFLVALVATLLAGGWLTGQWIVARTSWEQWHPGYFLPTVAGGLVAATVSAGLGETALARVLFGYGAVSWILVGSIILARLFTQAPLATALRPTLAIQLAPPVVAGVAWFRINGGRLDPVAYGLGGYALLMALVQLRLLPFYRPVPFGPGWWAFSFSYAAAVGYAIRWSAVEHAAGLTAWTAGLLAVATAGIVVLTARTVEALARDRFLPTPPVAATT